MNIHLSVLLICLGAAFGLGLSDASAEGFFAAALRRAHAMSACVMHISKRTMAFLARSELKAGRFTCAKRKSSRSESIVHAQYRCWEPPDCRWRLQAVHPWGPGARQLPKWVTKSLSARKKSPTSAWRRSMSSTRRTSKLPVYNLPEEVATGVVTAAATAVATTAAAAAVITAAAAVAAAAAEAAAGTEGFGGEVAAAVEAVQAATGAGAEAFGSGAITDHPDVAVTLWRASLTASRCCSLCRVSSIVRTLAI